ncbi:ABC transporter ATP-binding protein [Gordonia sp. ABSL1-1]|uniref:ABC transporter ATP-binding protein n=1 Tax=Gordonia sp. ABSL1-1 TaxID=3053923 RepID=UPI00257409C7|nr:ABC transporter ATP-binding protein [Gordonia sp. ABSL1-1]MDL9937930.1 ABC transporter ATP-binding protein [Gordonia sp. ABSL1-1]
MQNAGAHHRRALFAFIGCQLGVVATTLAAPALNAAMIDDGIMRGNIDTIERLAVVMTVVAFANLGLALGSTYLASHISASIAHRLRGQLNTQVTSFGDREAGRFSIGGLLTRCTADVANVQGFIFTFLTVMVIAPLMLVGALVVTTIGGSALTPVVAIAGAVLVATVVSLIRRLLPLSGAIQRGVDTLNRMVREQLIGVPVTRTFIREEHEIDRFDLANGELTELSVRAGRLQAALLPLVTVIANLATVLVAAVGAKLVDTEQMQIGQIAATTGYLLHILVAVSMLSILAGTLPRAAASGSRVAEVLDTPPDAVEHTTTHPPRAHLPRRCGGSIAPRLHFDAVTLHHPGAKAPALDAVTITCASGSVTAFIGGTGSGKSSLLALPVRLNTPTSGAIRAGDVDLADVDPRTIRARTAFVGQGSALVSGTVAENLRLGRPAATDDELWTALDVADAAGFVAARAHGLASEVTQDGRNFSGGQRQRLALARAILRRPVLYLLDDPFSALDVDTEARIIARLRTAAPEATIVIASQRVSSIRHADSIAVLEGGRITAIGGHHDLLRVSAVYRDLAAAQAVIDG